MRFKKPSIVMFLAILVIAAMPVVAAPGQPIVASSYPTQSIVSGDITINTPALEAPATSIAQSVSHAAQAISSTRMLLVFIFVLLVIIAVLELYAFVKTFMLSPPIKAEIKEISKPKKSLKGSTGKKRTARKPRAAAGFPSAPLAGATQG